MKSVALTFLVLLVLGTINGSQEGHINARITGALATPLSLLVPALYYLWSLHRGRKLPAALVFWVCAVLSILMYILYTAAGASNPETAGHMHVALAPMLIFIFSTLLCTIALTGEWVWRTLNKSSKKDGLTAASS